MGVKRRRRTRRATAGLSNVCARWPGPMIYRGRVGRELWLAVTAEPGFVWIVGTTSRAWSDEFRSLLKARK